MKKAVVTVAIGDSEMWELTHPLMRRYAERTGADFVTITGGYENSLQSRLKKFDIYDLFDNYDRLIYMDGDMAVHPRCPDLFEMIPYEKIGAVREKPPYSHGRGQVLKQACDFYGVPYPEANGGYRFWFNSGLMVLSRCHRDLFIRPEKVKIFGEGWIDMPLLNAMLVKKKYDLEDLGLKFNYMGSIVSHKDRPFEPVDSYIFHATGFLRLYRIEYLKMIIDYWYHDSRSDGEKTRAYRRDMRVLSYRVYETMRAKAAKLLKKRLPAAERKEYYLSGMPA